MYVLSVPLPDQVGADILAAAQVIDTSVIVAMFLAILGIAGTASLLRNRRKDESLAVQDRLIAAYKEEAEVSRTLLRAEQAKNEVLLAEWFEKLAVEIGREVAKVIREEWRRERERNP